MGTVRVEGRGLDDVTVAVMFDQSFRTADSEDIAVTVDEVEG